MSTHHSKQSKHPLRILFLTPAYPPFWGGGERYVQSLARVIHMVGHQVTVVTSQATAEQDFWGPSSKARQPVQQTVEQEITVIRCPLRPLVGGQTMLMALRKAMVGLSFLPLSRPLLWQMMRFFPPLHQLPETLDHLEKKFDVVHGFNLSWEQAMGAGWRFAQRHGIPFVVTPFAHFGAAHGTRDQTARLATMPHQLQMLRTAEAVLTLTNLEQDGLRDYGIPAEKLQTIWSGVDLPPENLTSSESEKVDEQFALFVGRLTADKGAIVAAQAVLAVNERGGSLKLLLIGRTDPAFERFYGGLTAAQQALIRPLGSVDDASKHRLLAQTEMLLLPSRSDSFGIVILEAWSHRKPVIGGRAGGIPAVIDEGKDGLLVTFGDVGALRGAIEQLLANPEERQRMGQMGYDKVMSQFNWPQVGRDVLTIYQSILTRLDPSG